MAPTRKRSSLRARAAKSPSDVASHPRTVYAPPPLAAARASNSLKRKRDGLDEAGWATTKKGKRAVKHNALMAKVWDAGVKKAKRRRPGRKLNVDLRGLGDALPEIDKEDDVWEGLSGDEGAEGGMDVEGFGLKKKRRRREAEGEGKMVMKSLKHRPGAMKRKRAIESKEMERFSRNLAQLAGNMRAPASGQGDGDSRADRVCDAAPSGLNETAQDQGRHADRWAALRRFIVGTVEKDKAFSKAEP